MNFLKRAFDFLCAAIGLIVLSPLFLILCFLIWREDKRSPFYKQLRVGQGGKSFALYKFRSMRINADKEGPAITATGDSRITAIGKILRRTKMDELPQLWNVLKGDMSLVGPRPEVEKYVRLYNPDQKRVLDVRPGVTDPASFVYFNESELLAASGDPENYYVRELMPAKIHLNLLYLQRATITSDLVVIFATIGKIFGVKIDLAERLKL